MAKKEKVIPSKLKRSEFEGLRAELKKEYIELWGYTFLEEKENVS